jgi:hypothetical protein
MPIIHKISKGLLLYDISGSVGYGKCVNQKGDVALVQYMLAAIYRKRTMKPLGRMIVDGSFGPMTHYWSLFFQLETKGRNDRDWVEVGNFLPSGNAKFGDKILSDDKMIVQLNNQLWELYPELEGGLEKDPAFPALLRGQIKAA